MERRRLGNAELEVSQLALGGNVFGWTVDEPTSFRLLDAFVSFGGNFIDTADTYSNWAPGNKGGESESILGRWLRRSGHRDKLIIATKVGEEMSPSRKGLSRSYILQAVENSLKRLQTDYIDLYQAHCDDSSTTLEETLGAFAQLIKQGRVRVIGASNYGPERLAQALQVSKRKGYPSYQSLQPLYNLCDRADYETRLEVLCQEQGLGVISYRSLARGFLAGKYRTVSDVSKSLRGEWGPGTYLNERGFRILRAVDEVAIQYGAAPASVSIAWLMSRPSVTVAIAGATNVDQLRDLAEGTRLRLDRSSIELLNRASAI